MQLSFLDGCITNITTEGIRYAGSKTKLIQSIMDILDELTDVSTVLDGFSGTTRVGQALKLFNYNVGSNDLAEYSKVFGNCYLINNKPKKYYLEYIAHLNNLVGIKGFFTSNYSSSGETSVGMDGKKKNWHTKNAMKIDVIRAEINKLTTDYVEQCVLLTSLMLAADKVSNNLGHQVSYLKDWAPRSLTDMVLEVPNLITGNKLYKIYQEDILNITDAYDLVYLDPPYNTNNTTTMTTRVRYASYYHIWVTLCKNDEPNLYGAANRREDVSSDSNVNAINDYESTNYDHVFNTFKQLFKNLNTKYILLSYNNKGKIVIPDLVEYISDVYNLISVQEISHKENVQKNLTTNKKWLGDVSDNFEYLIMFKK